MARAGTVISSTCKSAGGGDSISIGGAIRAARNIPVFRDIARDVAEDARRDRVYLPGSWVDPEDVLEAQDVRHHQPRLDVDDGGDSRP